MLNLETVMGPRCFLLPWHGASPNALFLWAVPALLPPFLCEKRRERQPLDSEQLVSSYSRPYPPSSPKELDNVWREAVTLLSVKSVTASYVFHFC